MEQQNNKRGSMMGAALLGAALGAAAGLLFAPKSGKETRQDLTDLMGRMSNEIGDRTSKLREVTKSAYNEIVDVVVKQYQEAKEITTEQAAKLREELRQGYERVKAVADEHKLPEGTSVEESPKQKSKK
ncbi:MAG TPA: YtxH domain-containing protein [Patescibacteria group bacterium]